MHDTIDLELRGIPALFVATEEFVDAAEKQSRALGYDLAAVYVPHPVQDRTDEEIHLMADGAVEAIVAALVEPL